jgi:hypothetical protein
MGDKAGRTAVVIDAPRELRGNISATSNSNSSTTLLAAGAAGILNDIPQLMFTNSSATATVVTITDGTNSYNFALAASGGCIVPIYLKATTAATAWTWSNSASATVYAVGSYITNK